MLELPFLLLTAVFVLHRVLRFLMLLRRHKSTMGYKVLFDPYSFPGNAIPTTWWNLGFRWTWIYRHTAHFEHAYDLSTIIPVFGNPYYIGASVDIAKQIWGNELKTNLAKPQDFTTEGIFGSSIASAQGADWSRHRRAVAPSLNTTMYSRIVEESDVVYRDMVSKETWEEKNNVVVADLDRILHRFALVMICRCGFGMSVEWTQGRDHSELSTFDRELSVAARMIILRFILPDWVWKLPIQSLRAIMQSWKIDGNITDLLTKLVSATDDANKYALKPAEVTANMMSLLFAGNETTSSALLSTITLLALHSDEQEKAYQDILREASCKDSLSLSIINNLRHLFACFNEAHRLVPVTINLPRVTTEDTPIHSNDFPEPEKYIPSRWYDATEHDFLMFGFGPRACVGRKFAQIEAVCFLAHFLRDWKVEVILEAGETAIEAWDRIAADATLRGTAFSLGSVPIKFVARDSN
ncbi:cytochrome P450 [Armillaria fumosa]|nr:cytochrome P450 [Armillaria fumosa]